MSVQVTPASILFQVVHCSAGVGRTGTFIVVDAMLQRIAAEKTVDVYGYVLELRRNRNIMVQVEEQYVFIHEVLLEAINSGYTEIKVTDLRIHIRNLMQINTSDGELDESCHHVYHKNALHSCVVRCFSTDPTIPSTFFCVTWGKCWALSIQRCPRGTPSWLRSAFESSNRKMGNAASAFGCTPEGSDSLTAVGGCGWYSLPVIYLLVNALIEWIIIIYLHEFTINEGEISIPVLKISSSLFVNECR